jgi:putative glutamine amidotransferase
VGVAGPFCVIRPAKQPMQHRPIVGIPAQSLQAIDRIPEDLPPSWVMNQRYYEACAQSGAAPFMVPLLDEDPGALRALYDALDGIFLAGGVDVDPASYGEERDERCGRTDLARDRVELAFAKWAIHEGKPLLGVCRGMQVVNVATGGTLLQDCAAHWKDAVKHDFFPGQGYPREHLAHGVTLAPGSRLAEAFGAGHARVNSMHHQGILRLGDGLRATAWAPDGLIEAVEGQDGTTFLAAVQWHPEVLIDSDAGTARLFGGFVEACRAYRARREALIPG